MNPLGRDHSHDTLAGVVGHSHDGLPLHKHKGPDAKADYGLTQSTAPSSSIGITRIHSHRSGSAMFLGLPERTISHTHDDLPRHIHRGADHTADYYLDGAEDVVQAPAPSDRHLRKHRHQEHTGRLVDLVGPALAHDHDGLGEHRHSGPRAGATYADDIVDDQTGRPATYSELTDAVSSVAALIRNYSATLNDVDNNPVEVGLVPVAALRVAMGMKP